ncbi:MAG: nucleotide exchange factor GrpE [Phycisphaerae bacterium]
MFGSRNKQKPDSPADSAATTTSAARTVSDASVGGVAPQPVAGPEADIAQLQAEVTTLRDQHLRNLAELRNANQRWQREKQEAVKYAEADFARELLVVLDGLERTLESARSAGDALSIAEGLRIVHEQFLKALAAHHIEPIQAAGVPFDPHVHEALMQRPSDDVSAGAVLQEVQRGFRMHDRVIRTARVIVSSGPATPTAATNEGAAPVSRQKGTGA